jgi:hypothetical protein
MDTKNLICNINGVIYCACKEEEPEDCTGCYFLGTFEHPSSCDVLHQMEEPRDCKNIIWKRLVDILPPFEIFEVSGEDLIDVAKSLINNWVAYGGFNMDQRRLVESAYKQGALYFRDDSGKKVKVTESTFPTNKNGYVYCLANSCNIVQNKL